MYRISASILDYKDNPDDLAAAIRSVYSTPISVGCTVVDNAPEPDPRLVFSQFFTVAAMAPNLPTGIAFARDWSLTTQLGFGAHMRKWLCALRISTQSCPCYRKDIP